MWCKMDNFAVHNICINLKWGLGMEIRNTSGLFANNGDQNSTVHRFYSTNVGNKLSI